MQVLGIDEVGRGCWAGPLVAGAVVLHTLHLEFRRDSKLSAAQRTKLSVLIEKHGHVGLGWVTPQELDELGLTKAVGLAMKRAVEGYT